jgi:hypothetical protein
MLNKIAGPYFFFHILCQKFEVTYYWHIFISFHFNIWAYYALCVFVCECARKKERKKKVRKRGKREGGGNRDKKKVKRG